MLLDNDTVINMIGSIEDIEYNHHIDDNSSDGSSSYSEINCDEQEDNIGDFVMSTLDDINESDTDCIDILEEEGYIDDIPTTNAGAFATEVEHVTKYGGSFGNIKIAGHVILNQCGTLLT